MNKKLIICTVINHVQWYAMFDLALWIKIMFYVYKKKKKERESERERVKINRVKYLFNIPILFVHFIFSTKLLPCLYNLYTLNLLECRHIIRNTISVMSLINFKPLNDTLDKEKMCVYILYLYIHTYINKSCCNFHFNLYFKYFD